MIVSCFPLIILVLSGKLPDFFRGAKKASSSRLSKCRNSGVY